MLSDGFVEVNKYLDFASHNPAIHKEAVVSTILKKSNILPWCTNNGRAVVEEVSYNTVTGEATGVCGPSLYKGCVQSLWPRPPEILRSGSL